MAKEVARGVHGVSLGGVNAFLIEAGDGLVLIDAGLRRSPARITEAIYSLDRLPQQVSTILVSHAHHDHVGGLAEMQRRTGAEVWAHPADAALLRQGLRGRPREPGPSSASRTAVALLSLWPSPQGEPLAVAREIDDGEVLPFDALRAVHTPGHSAGHLSFLLPRDGGVLFVGDAATHWLRPALGRLHEDAAESRRSLEKLAALEFETACFAHGRPIRSGASQAFRDLTRRLGE
jgi:glyoxylase-like metal-dependent hydrolase (beta-lactamase superfamily II)